MNKKLLIIVAVVTPLVFGAAYAAFKLTSGGSSPRPALVVAAKPTPVVSTDPGMIYPLPERLLNLTPSDGTPHYARIELAIAFQRPEGVKAPKPPAAAGTVTALEPGLASVQSHKVQIDDAVVRVVGAETYSDLATTDGREALKRNLLDAVRLIVPSPAPAGVYIVDLVVQ